MLGYDAQDFRVARNEFISGQTVILRLVASEGLKRGLIEVDLSGWTGIVTFIEMHEAESGNSGLSGGNERLVSEKRWRSRPAVPGVYVLRIRGRPNWESAPVIVKSDETTVVAPDFYLACSVTARVFDENNKPFAGGVLTRWVSKYVFYGFRNQGPQPETGNLATSGVDGRATIHEIREGNHQFLVEANGYEPQIIKVELKAGERKDLGDFYLVKAKGRIVVRLKGMRQNQAYGVSLLQLRGGVVRHVRSTTAVEVIFDGVPCRPYVVGSSLAQGGKTASANVHPTTESPEVIVEIDVSALEPKQE